MIPSIEETVLLIVAVFCVLGLGWLGKISEAYGEMRARKVQARLDKGSEKSSDA